MKQKLVNLTHKVKLCYETGSDEDWQAASV